MTTDLSTTYLGLTLRNPIVVSACPLTGELDVLQQLQERGAAAAVLPSLFEEQLSHGVAGAASEDSCRVYDQLAYFHALKEYNRGPDVYLKHLTEAKRAVSIPIIGSLNLTGKSEAIQYARRIEEAGADALELNIYFVVADAEASSQDVESRYLELVAAVRDLISIPLAVKIGPFFTALPNFARRLVASGANGLVLFNRFMQPDIDLDTVRVVPRLTLSSPDEIRLSLRWVALLSGRLEASLAATSGIHCADDAIKVILAGADVAMVASTLYRHGVDALPTLVNGMAYWLEQNDFSRLDQIKGKLSQRNCPDPAVFERANYTRMLASFADQRP
jgi:dihydroorotate dehydrogenase (fumarate)